MTPDQRLKLIEIIATSLTSLAWPLLILFLLVFYSRPLKKFLDNLGELSLKALGVEATIKKQQQAEASKALFPDVENTIRSILQSETIIKELKEAASKESSVPAEDVAKLLNNVADKAVETIRQSNFITVDSRPLVGAEGEVWELPYSQFSTVSEFLDNLWFLLRPYGIPSMRYDISWILQDTITGKEFRSMGRGWANRSRSQSRDTRSLSDVGIHPGMKLEAIPLNI